ncbi:FSH1-domain-containing protein [Auriculariales sp. MPI-PUGE-AT-0066]|nr:FSH1-domain-containing protein [Auriculariales sp. MPI-PUGE-AT-0066]
MRILALHGYTQNAHILSKRLGAIRKACGKDCEFVFLDGPIILSKTDMKMFGTANLEATQIEEEPTDPELIPRAWWKRADDGNTYRGFDSTIQYIRDFLVKQEQPFDGIIGFSQGSGLAAMLTALLERPREAAKFDLLVDGKMPHPPFEFCVLVSGFLPNDPLLARVITNASDDKPPGIHTRTLHIVGNTDILVTPEKSQSLIDHSRNARVERHAGGHFIPATGPWRQFFKSYFNAVDDNEAAALPSPAISSAPVSGTSTPAQQAAL